MNTDDILTDIINYSNVLDETKQSYNNMFRLSNEKEGVVQVKVDMGTECFKVSNRHITQSILDYLKQRIDQYESALDAATTAWLRRLPNPHD